MTNKTLAANYFKKVRARIKALHTLRAEESYSDVIRECQEAYELMLKGLLRLIGVDPPKWHDVAPVLRDFVAKLKPQVAVHIERIALASLLLRKDRELSFYGDDDFLPDDSYTLADADRWIGEVEWLYELINREYKAEIAGS